MNSAVEEEEERQESWEDVDGRWSDAERKWPRFSHMMLAIGCLIYSRYLFLSLAYVPLHSELRFPQDDCDYIMYSNILCPSSQQQLSQQSKKQDTTFNVGHFLLFYLTKESS